MIIFRSRRQCAMIFEYKKAAQNSYRRTDDLSVSQKPYSSLNSIGWSVWPTKDRYLCFRSKYPITTSVPSDNFQRWHDASLSVPVFGAFIFYVFLFSFTGCRSELLLTLAHGQPHGARGKCHARVRCGQYLWTYTYSFSVDARAGGHTCRQWHLLTCVR